MNLIQTIEAEQIAKTANKKVPDFPPGRYVRRLA
jgi:ribosomal protein L19